MLIFLLSSISVVLLFYICVKAKSTAFVLPLLLGVLFYIPAFFDVFGGGGRYAGVLFEANAFALFVNIALALSVIFSGAFKVGVMQIPTYAYDEWRCSRDRKKRASKFLKILAGVLLLALIAQVYAVWQSTGGAILAYSWADKHAGDSNVFFLVATYLFLIASGAVYLSYKQRRYSIFCFCLMVAIAFIILNRSRGFIVPVLMPFLIDIVLVKRAYAKALMFGLVFLLIFFFLQQLRYMGGLDNFNLSGTYSFVDKVVEKINDDSSEFSLRLAYYYFIQNYDRLAAFDFGGLASYWRIAFFFDVFNLGLKPADFTNAMYRAYYGDSDLSNPTLHPLLYGSVYADGQWVSIVALVMVLMPPLLIERWIKKKGREIYFVTLPAFSYLFVFVGRGSIYNAYISFAVALLGVYGIYRFSTGKIRWNRPASQG